MSPEILLAVLSSSLLSGVIVALVAGIFSLRSKKNEYVNEYYKLVLKKRVEAYEEVENLVIRIKVAVRDKDKDNRPYHLLFSDADDQIYVYKALFKVMSQALWLTDDLFSVTRELNVLIFTNSEKHRDMVEFGRVHYIEIGRLRTRMEALHARDILRLHQVPRFLRSKKPSDAYTLLPPGG